MSWRIALLMQQGRTAVLDLSSQKAALHVAIMQNRTTACRWAHCWFRLGLGRERALAAPRCPIASCLPGPLPCSRRWAPSWQRPGRGRQRRLSRRRAMPLTATRQARPARPRRRPCLHQRPRPLLRPWHPLGGASSSCVRRLPSPVAASALTSQSVGIPSSSNSCGRVEDTPNQLAGVCRCGSPALKFCHSLWPVLRSSRGQRAFPQAAAPVRRL